MGGVEMLCQTALQEECRRVDMEESAPAGRKRFACTQEASRGIVFSAVEDKLSTFNFELTTEN
jgi:hypothetical protein